MGVNGSDLCLPCGMCCDGSLFEIASLRPGEEAFTASLGMTVLHENISRSGFQLPCPLFQTRCTIYDQPRPAVCAGFKCKLLRKYENENIGISEAIEQVHRARAMQAELSSLLPTPASRLPSLAEVKRQMQALARGAESQRRVHLGFLLLAAKYELFLRNHFMILLRKNIRVEELPGMGDETGKG